MSRRSAEIRRGPRPGRGASCPTDPDEPALLRGRRGCTIAPEERSMKIRQSQTRAGAQRADREGPARRPPANRRATGRGAKHDRGRKNPWPRSGDTNADAHGSKSDKKIGDKKISV